MEKVGESSAVADDGIKNVFPIIIATICLRTIIRFEVPLATVVRMYAPHKHSPNRTGKMQPDIHTQTADGE